MGGVAPAAVTPGKLREALPELEEGRYASACTELWQYETRISKLDPAPQLEHDANRDYVIVALSSEASSLKLADSLQQCIRELKLAAGAGGR